MSEPMIWLLVRGVWETLAMTFVSGFFGFVLGLPVGVLLYVTRPGQIVANAKLYRTLSAVVNIFRSIPFIILLVWMIPFTRVIVGTSIGLQAAIVPLTVGAAPSGNAIVLPAAAPQNSTRACALSHKIFMGVNRYGGFFQT